MDAALEVPGSAAQPPIIRKPAKKPAWRGLLVGVFSGALGALLAMGAVRLLGEDMTGVGDKEALRVAFGAWTGAVVALTALIAGYLAIVTHEVGHLVGGKLAGFRFFLFVAGPLRIDRDSATDRIRVGLNRDLSLAGGIAGCLPTGTEALPRRLGLMVAGGPAFSFLLAGAAAALTAGPAAEGPALLKSMLGLMMIISFGLGVVTLIPMRFSGFASDGARLLRLARGGPQAHREAAILALVALTTMGTPPRDLSDEMVGSAIAARDGTSDECTANLLAYTQRLDRGDTAGARAALHRSLELADQYPPAFVPAMMVEAAFFEGFVSRDAAAARAYLAEVPAKSMVVSPFDRLRAEGAIALAEGDVAGARERFERARAVAPASDPFRRTLLDRMAAATNAEPASA
ncbi:hypothetical protein [Longimicrobium sp.]|uniref:hypothetical protein n=1 Tax=Longimicrobium sp. TaxID=2029185 RepID=UPI003B3B52E9